MFFFPFLALILYLCRNFLLFLVMESHESAQVQHGGKQAHVMIDDFAQQFQIRVSAIKPTKCQRHLKAARKAKSTNLSTQTYCKCRRSPRKESNSWHSKTMQSHSKRETPGNISLNINEGFDFFFQRHGSHLRNVLLGTNISHPKACLKMTFLPQGGIRSLEGISSTSILSLLNIIAGEYRLVTPTISMKGSISECSYP